jgi:hypothetical protein
MLMRTTSELSESWPSLVSLRFDILVVDQVALHVGRLFCLTNV